MAKRKYNLKRRKSRKRISNKAKIIRSIFLFILLIMILLFISFRSWRSKQKALSQVGNQIVFTSMGQIEYKSIGSGPVIILSHMGGAGSDNIKLFKEISDAGYRIICPSRPGYIQTPLSENADFEYQADMYAELLKQLNITGKVFIIGVSAGGPSAIEFASKYSSQCRGLILYSAITKHFSPLNRMKEFSQLINIMLSPTWQDPLCWINHVGSKIFPAKSIEEILERATTYKHDKIKAMAVQLAKVEKNKQSLFLFNDFTSPLSIRTDGLKNDLKFAENYTPSKVDVPVLITHSRVDKVVDFFHAKSFKNKLKNAELFEYDGSGHAFWFGKEWTQIRNKTLAFLNKYKTKMPEVIKQDIIRLTSETWVNKINGAILKININGTFTLDFPGVDEKEFVIGTIKFNNKSLTFLAKKDSKYCQNIKGIYHFKITKNELLLSVDKDNCTARKEHFTGGWFKL